MRTIRGGAVAAFFLASHGLPVGAAGASAPGAAPSRPPNVLFIMTDQQRWDTIHALGNSTIYTPNLDRLARRGVAFLNAYSQCPVCVPARYTIRTGCESRTTRVFQNAAPLLLAGEPATMTARCGPYLATTMKGLGYRTFGIGKFHTYPRWDEPLGYEVQLDTEEIYGSAEQRRRDTYGAWIAREHPVFDYLEGLRGERTEMYYEPQCSPMPAALTMESWVADQAVGQIRADDGRPYFGLVSFVGPHPPLAPPIPFNRMYNPDLMPNPVRGDPAVDQMDEQITWMNYAVWAESVHDPQARILKARYYGEISFVDACIGRLLNAVEARGDASNTLICFFSDHGDLLGDHDGWQKECYFEGACHISLPGELAGAPGPRAAARGVGVPDGPVWAGDPRGGENATAARGGCAGPDRGHGRAAPSPLRLLRASEHAPVQDHGPARGLEIYLHAQWWARAVVQPARGPA